jgi:tetraprenyl-beta-curcumene synthase
MGALVRATSRELAWGLRGVSHEVAHWRRLAASIPDEALRHDALEAIEDKRANIDGAALFSTIPHARSPELLRLLVAYEILADFLDCTSERGAHIGTHNGLQLHRALIDALDPSLPTSDYYRYHPWQEDAGFLHTLLVTCRDACARLPSYSAVRQPLTRAARLAQVLALNHEENPELRDELLRAWASAHFPGRSEVLWFEWTGGASAWLTILALLALATDSHRDLDEAEAVYGAYLPWISLAGTMLDSYGDVDQDSANAAHSYIAHYSSPEQATQRIAAIIRRSLREAGSLPDGARHVVIVSCMVAMYLSKDNVRTPGARPRTTSLIDSAGPLARLLLPALRAWRVIYNQRAA